MLSYFNFKPVTVAIITAFTATSLTGCGTLTGIPSHGGGKRFAIEQRLVSASIRSTLMNIDVSPLKGHKVVIIYDMISDEGAGTLNGGRMNLMAGMSSAFIQSPITTANSAYQLFNFVDTGTNYSNQTGANTANT